MLKLRHWLLAVAASVPCLLLLADDDAVVQDPRNVVVDWQRFQRQGPPEPVMLDEPVRLEFQFDEADSHRFDVACASEDYRISIDMVGPDNEIHVEVSGTVRPLDDPDRLFLSFDATIHRANLAEGGEQTFSGTGSAIVMLGEHSRLITFPGPSISVTASLAE